MYCLMYQTYIIAYCFTDGFEESTSVTELEVGNCYSQGNYQTLQSFLGKITEKENPKVRADLALHTTYIKSYV